jgi:ABC-type multidrug transport system fused ATPase/permease subunit
VQSEDLSAERGRTLRRGFRVIGLAAKHEPWVFTGSVVGAVVYGLGTASGGWVLGGVTDRVLAPAFAAGRVTSEQLWDAGGSLALVALVTVIGVATRRGFATWNVFRLQARYRRAVTEQYVRLPLAWHHRHPAGQLLSNANSDVEAIWQVMAPLPMALGVIVMLIAGIVAMFLADPVLAVVGLLVLPGIMGANTYFQRRMNPRIMLAQQLRGEVSTVAHESFEGAVVVKTMGREAEETERFAAESRRLAEANIDVGRSRSVFDPMIEALPTIGTLAVLLIGTARVAAGQAATGDVVQVAYLLTLLAFPIRSFGWVLSEIPRSVVGFDRVSAVLRAGGEMRYGTAEPERSGPAALAVAGADYAHADQDGTPVPVLHGITFDVPAGTTVALVGPTGSGKSTVAGLLVRLVDPADGRILLDGVDLRDLRRGAVSGAAALVPQATFVFDDSVRENVTLGEQFSDEEVWAALRLAQADSFVARLPRGLETELGERGTSLSGGQRQRLALARALIRKPRLLVLDDSTSAVDPRIEARILAALRRADPRTTVLVIAYRSATIQLADEVAYLAGGRLEARGRHEELILTSPGYQELVTAYARDAADRRAAAKVEEGAA